MALNIVKSNDIDDINDVFDLQEYNISLNNILPVGYFTTNIMSRKNSTAI